MSTIFDLLSRVRENPGLYIGYPSVNRLFMFLNGYEVARGEMGVALTETEELFYDDFQHWLQNRLGVCSIASWAKLIMRSCADERTGFDKFFELLPDFQQAKVSGNEGCCLITD